MVNLKLAGGERPCLMASAELAPRIPLFPHRNTDRPPSPAPKYNQTCLKREFSSRRLTQEPPKSKIDGFLLRCDATPAHNLSDQTVVDFDVVRVIHQPYKSSAWSPGHDVCLST
jgi:hypothetical protein